MIRSEVSWGNMQYSVRRTAYCAKRQITCMVFLRTSYFMRTKQKFGLTVLSVVRLFLFCTRDVKVRCNIFFSYYSLCIGNFIPNPRNASVAESFSSSLLDNCYFAIEIRSVVHTCVECVSTFFISKSDNVHKQ